MDIPNFSKEDLPQKVQDMIGDNDFVIDPFIDEDLDEIGLGPAGLAQISRDVSSEIRSEFAEQMGKLLSMNKNLKKAKKRKDKKRHNIISIIDELNISPN